MQVKVIDDHLLSFRDITHKTIPLDIVTSGHNSLILFNVIKALFNIIILELL